MRRSVKIFVVAVVAVAVAAAFVATRHPRAAPVPKVILLAPGYVIPPQKVPLIERVVPATRSWGWYWKLKEMILGRRKSIEVDAVIIDLSAWSESWTNTLALAAPTFSDANNLRIWFLDNGQVVEVKKRLKQDEHADSLSIGRIITGAESEARLSSGMTLSAWDNQLRRVRPVEVGLSMDMMPRVRGGVIDLTTLLRFSTAVTNQSSVELSDPSSISIQTNLAFAARLQIPDNGGVFLLKANSSDKGTNRSGLILSTRIWKPGK